MEFNYAVSTPLGVPQAVQAVTDGLQEAGFGVLWALDVQAKLKEKGLELSRPVRILEVCQPAKARDALEDDVMISYFLPCKVVVYQEGEGTTVGFVRPEMFAGLFPDSKVFPRLAREVDGVLRGALDRLA